MSVSQCVCVNVPTSIERYRKHEPGGAWVKLKARPVSAGVYPTCPFLTRCIAGSPVLEHGEQILIYPCVTLPAKAG